MTILTTIPTSTTRAFSSEVATGSRQENASNQKSGALWGSRPLTWRAALWLARGRRLANRFLAAMIARHERHATRIAMHRLDDRQLKDIAMVRSQIDSRLEELAQTARADAAAGMALRVRGVTICRRSRGLVPRDI